VGPRSLRGEHRRAACTPYNEQMEAEGKADKLKGEARRKANQ
jgi:hypothetical protein